VGWSRSELADMNIEHPQQSDRLFPQSGSQTIERQHHHAMHTNAYDATAKSFLSVPTNCLFSAGVW